MTLYRSLQPALTLAGRDTRISDGSKVGYIVLCYVVLRCVAFCCVVLYCIVLCGVVLSRHSLSPLPLRIHRPFPLFLLVYPTQS